MLSKLKLNIKNFVTDVEFSLCRLFYCKLFKEDELMMAMLWAQQIMKQETLEEAKVMYIRVPRLLKEKVKQILIVSGMEEIVAE